MIALENDVYTFVQTSRIGMNLVAHVCGIELVRFSIRLTMRSR